MIDKQAIDNAKTMISVLNDASKRTNALYRIDGEDKENSKELSKGFLVLGLTTLRALYGPLEGFSALLEVLGEIGDAVWDFDLSDEQLEAAKKQTFAAADVIARKMNAAGAA